MDLVTWDESYSVKIKSIDEQHKKLIDIVNKLHDAMSAGKSKEHIGDILNEVLDYTKYHFNYEEALMQKAGYEDLEGHKKIHNKFVSQIENFCERQKKGDLFLSFELSTSLFDWLINHIKGTDMLYTEKMLAQGLS